MKNIEPYNDEDAKVWSALEVFDFDGYRTKSELRVALYKHLLESMGYCFMCTQFVKSENWCKLLKTRTGSMDRCCDFDKVEQDDKPAFDIMVEHFVEEQNRTADAVRINKYTHCSNKVGQGKAKAEGLEKSEDEEEQ